MSIAGMLALQGVLWGLSYLLREDEPEDGDEDDKATKFMGTVKAGEVVPIVFGKCLVLANPSMIYSQGSGTVYIEGQFPIGLIPNSGFPIEVVAGRAYKKFQVGHYFFGGKIINRAIGLQTTPPQQPQPFTFQSPDFWGGEGHGGGVGFPLANGTFVNPFRQPRPNGTPDTSVLNPGAGQFFVTPGYVYEVLDAQALSDNPAATLRRVIAGGHNMPLTYTTEFLQQVITGPGGYTNTAYLIIEDLMIGEGEFKPSGETHKLPSIEVEAICIPKYFDIESQVDGLELTTADYAAQQRFPDFITDRSDANPASVLYCILVDDVVGLSTPPEDIDYTSFVDASKILKVESNGFSMVVTKSTDASKLLKEVLKQMDGVLYSDPITRQLTLKLIRQDYGVSPFSTLFSADPSNCLQVVDYKVSAPEDLFNQVKIKFKNRAKHYVNDEAISQDSSSVNDGRPAQIVEFTYPGVKTAKLANTIAARELTRVATPTTSMTLQLNREFAGHTPGDVFLWSWPDYGIVNMVLRILQIDYGTLEDNKITVVCVKDKDAITESSFSDPGDFTVRPPTRPEFQGSADFFEPSDTSNLGGFDLDSDLWRGRIALMLSAQDSATSALLEWSRDNGLTYNTISIDHPITPTGRLGVAYNRVAGESYDTTVGITMLKVSELFPTGPFTESQIAHGDNLIKIDDEVLSFETATDLGNQNFLLNNIWRGLLDTTASDHSAGSSVSSLSGVSQSKYMTAVRPGSDGTVLFRTRMRTLGTIQPIEEATYLQATFKSRGKSPTAPENLDITKIPRDEITGDPEVGYTFDVDDNTSVTFRALSGNLGGTVSDGGIVTTNEAKASWARRDSTPQTVVRGDSSDVAPASEDVIRYNLEHRRVGESTWNVAQSVPYGNSYKNAGAITKSEEYLNLGKLLPGPNEVRVCAVRDDIHTGRPICSVDTQSQIIDVIAPRQLLSNGMLSPFWDIHADSTGEAYGEGLKVLGNGTSSARGWETSGDNPVEFGVPVLPMQQGLGTTGFAAWASQRPDIADQHSIFQQLVPIPVGTSDTINKDSSKAVLSFYYFRDDASSLDFYSAKLECLDVSGTVVSTTGGTDIAGTSTTGWTRIETSLVVESTATALRVVLALRHDSNKFNHNYIADVQLHFAPEISSQLLAQNTFIGGLASWTTTGTWITATSALGINKLTQDPGSMAYVTTPASGGKSELSQIVSMPAGYTSGDWIKFSFWVARLNAQNATFRLILSCRNGSGVISSDTLGVWQISKEDHWIPYEIWLPVKEFTTNIGVEFTMFHDSGATTDIAVDGLQLHVYKADQRATTLNYDVPVTQSVPSTPQEFSIACGEPEIFPAHIFLFDDAEGQDLNDTAGVIAFDEVTGVDGVDLLRGGVTTAPWNGTTFTGNCLELRTPTGGVKCSDQSFLDPKNRSIAIYFRYKMSSFGHSGKSNIISKIHRNPTPSNGAGFQIYFDAATSKIHMYLSSNKSGADTFSATVELDLGTVDNDTHWVCFKIDLLGAVMSCFGDVGVGTAADINPLLSLDFSNIEDKAVIGYNDELSGSFDGGFAAPFQLSMMSVLKGASVRKFTKAVADRMWHRGEDPNTGFELTYNRTDELILPVSASEVGSFSGSNSSEAVAPPISYWDSLTTGNKLALTCPDDSTNNRITYAEDFSDASWTKSNVVISDKKHKSPLGLATAQEFSQNSVAGGYVQKLVTGLVANDYYTFSMYLESVATPKIKSELDFRTPVKGDFFGSVGAYEFDFWDFQNLVGNTTFINSANTDRGAGTATLLNVSGLPAQTAYGVSNGIDLTSYKCWEAATATDGLIASDDLVGDSNLEDFAFTTTIRMGKSPTGVNSIVGKIASGGSPGWLLYMSVGSLRLYIEDDSANVVELIVASAQAELSDGATHTISGFYDESADLLYLRGDTFSQVSVSTVIVTGSLTNTQELRIGSSHVDTIPNLQMLAFGFTKGANANNYYSEVVDMPGQDPTGEMTTQSRSSIISVPIDTDGHVCHYGQDMLSIAQSGTFTDPGYSLAVNDATQNLVSDSETLSTWADTDVTVIDNNEDSPDGFRSMSKITASADAGYVAETMTTVSSTLSAISVYVKDADTKSTSGKLILHDDVGNVEIASQVFTTTQQIQRITLIATTSSVTTSLRIELATSGKSIHAWGAQYEVGGYVTFYVRSLGAATTSVRSYYASTKFYTDREFGQIQSVSSKIAVRGNVALWNCISAGGNQNRVRLLSNSVTNTYNVYDGTGVSEDSISVSHGESLSEELHTCTLDQSIAGDNTGGFESVINYQGVEYTGSISPWEGSVGAGSEVFRLDIGSIGGGFVQPGYYQTIKSFRGKEEEPSPSEVTHQIQIELLRADLTTVLATLTRPAVAGWSRVSIDAQVLDTSAAVRIYGGTSATTKTSCRAWGLMLNKNETSGGYPIVLRPDAGGVAFPTTTQFRVGMSANELGNADEGRIEATVALPLRTSGAVRRPIVSLFWSEVNDGRFLYGDNAATDGTTFTPSFDSYNHAGVLTNTYDSAIAITENAETVIDVSWRAKAVQRTSGEFAEIVVDGVTAAIGVTTAEDSGAGLTSIEVGSVSVDGEFFDGGIQKLVIHGNGSPVIAAPAAPVAARVWSNTLGEHVSAFPLIPVPSMLSTMQRTNSLIPDLLNTNNFVPIATPTFGSAAEDGRVGVTIPVGTDGLQLTDADRFNPDGLKDMTYMIRAYLPAYTGSNPGIFGKRGGSEFPGFSVYMTSLGYIGVVQDGGNVGREDFTLALDHRLQYVDIAYVIDRSGANEGRIETTLGTASDILSTIPSLASTDPLVIGRVAGEGRLGLVGMIGTYFTVWEGVALTRTQLLEIWTPQLP